MYDPYISFLAYVQNSYVREINSIIPQHFMVNILHNNSLCISF